MIVIKPVRITEGGNVIKAPVIFTDHTKTKDALDQANELSGLARFDSWHHLVYGELISGRIMNDGKFDAQVNRIVRSSMNKRKRIQWKSQS